MKSNLQLLLSIAFVLGGYFSYSQSSTLIGFGSSWKYLDNGSNQGTAWRTNGFNDTGWQTGNAQLGYGDGDEATVLSYGPSSSAKYITTYFRKTINITNPATYSGVILSVKRDDGIVVYINGTERYRNNMPIGTISYNTYASSACSDDGKTIFTANLATSFFISGTNVIAVEIHQSGGSSSDISFDLSLTGNTTTSCSSIGCFTSIQPTAQTQKLVLPSTHTFQMLFKQGNSYSVGGGTAPGGHDFTGYIPKSGSSTQGYVSVNHENSPGGVSILDLSYNSTSKLWVRNSSQAVSFSASSIVKTERNCSGGITPWGTIITAEETRNTGDANGDGYADTGWLVEIDPATKQVKQYGNGRTEKLWALGRMSHENCVLKNDNRTVYYGEDASDGAVYKFVANSAGNLSAGTLYVLKLNSALSGGEPTNSGGSWIVVPNSTKSDRNNTYSLAISLGATKFNGVEDVEISPDGKIYFTSKGNSRVYRFTDNGSSISGFETFVGGKSYSINYGSGTVSEAWGSGNDNLAFDGEGNLYVLQDGGRNHIWMVKPSHTQANPQVQLFATTPAGGEPTGITFTPDYKFMFLSIQHPSSSNGTQTDASGATVAFNGASTIVIARKENLGSSSGARQLTEESEILEKIRIYPVPHEGLIHIDINLEYDSEVIVKIKKEDGTEVGTLMRKKLKQGKQTINFNSSDLKGLQILEISVDRKVYSKKIISK